MDTSMIKGMAVGGIAMVVLGAGAVSGYKAMTKPEFADVVAVKDVVETVVTPQEKCEDVQVQQQAQVKDRHRIAGTVVGGLAGGLLGSTIGGGKGKTVATVAGAAAGGYAGNEVQKHVTSREVWVTKVQMKDGHASAIAATRPPPSSRHFCCERKPGSARDSTCSTQTSR